MFTRKFIRFSIALVIISVALLLIAGLFQSNDVTVTRSIVMNASKDSVFNKMVLFKNWPSWSPWSQMDTSMKNEFSGNDGQPGSIYHWTGDEHKTGEAEIKNTSVTGTEMHFTFTLIKPGEMHANGLLKAEDAPGGTKATMSFTNHYNYPWNALVFLTNLEKSIGPDLEKALANMKTDVEKK